MLTKRTTPGLYAITDENLISDDRLNEAVRQAISGGARIIQYRNKLSKPAKRLQQASELSRYCQAAGVTFLINDDVELVIAAGADGVHLGREDMSLTEARERLGPEATIGVSCYASIERALAAEQAGADYVAFGRFFPSSTKPDAPAVSLDTLHLAAKKISLPLVAIGGITLENGAQLIRAGADYLAVIQGLFGAKDITGRARQYTELFNLDKDPQ